MLHPDTYNVDFLKSLIPGSTAPEICNHRRALENAQPVFAVTESGARHSQSHKILGKTGRIFLWDTRFQITYLRKEPSLPEGLQKV